jgi:hypothetical protein
MSLVKDTWQQFVQRRLWPVAIVLLAALVAVPVLLAKNPTPAAPVPAPANGGASASTDVAMTQPVVSPAQRDDSRRHVLGARKDVFRPEVTPTPTPSTTTVTSSKTSKSSTGGTPAGGNSGGSTTPITVPAGTGGGIVTPGVTKPKPKTWPGDSLTVRFSTGDTTAPKSVLLKDKGLPADGAAGATTDAQPLLVYLGLAKGGKEALFLLDASLKADGDGRCDGDGSADCATLHLRAGDTEFLDVIGDAGTVTASYQLDLLAIHPSKKTKAAAAKAAKQARAARKSARAATAAVVKVAGAASTGGSASLGEGVGALLGSL